MHSTVTYYNTRDAPTQRRKKKESREREIIRCFPLSSVGHTCTPDLHHCMVADCLVGNNDILTVASRRAQRHGCGCRVSSIEVWTRDGRYETRLTRQPVESHRGRGDTRPRGHTPRGERKERGGAEKSAGVGEPAAGRGHAFVLWGPRGNTHTYRWVFPADSGAGGGGSVKKKKRRFHRGSFIDPLRDESIWRGRRARGPIHPQRMTAHANYHAHQPSTGIRGGGDSFVQRSMDSMRRAPRGGSALGSAEGTLPFRDAAPAAG